jgi:hypothetical protein
MNINTFIKNVLVDITKGVKCANLEIKGENGENVFALKNSNWFIDKINGCISFDLIIENKDEDIRLMSSDSKISDNSHRVKFNVTQINPIS